MEWDGGVGGLGLYPLFLFSSSLIWHSCTSLNHGFKWKRAPPRGRIIMLFYFGLFNVIIVNKIWCVRSQPQSVDGVILYWNEWSSPSINTHTTHTSIYILNTVCTHLQMCIKYCTFFYIHIKYCMHIQNTNCTVRHAYSILYTLH